MGSLEESVFYGGSALFPFSAWVCLRLGETHYTHSLDGGGGGRERISGVKDSGEEKEGHTENTDCL